MHVVSADEHPFSAIARELVGDDHRGVGVCVLRNTGQGPLRQGEIHVSPRFGTHWLDDGD